MPSRTVRFFEILDAKGSQMPDLDWDGLLEAVRRLPSEDAYVDIARMELLGSTYRPGRGSTRSCPMLILDRITREVRMRIENNRRYRPLSLEKGDTLAEPTHYGLFPSNVVGILRAGTHTPGAASIRDFLNKGEFFEEPVTITALADVNAVRALGEVGRLTKVDIEMDAAAAAAALGKNSLLGDVFDSFRTHLGGVSVEVIVKIGRAQHDAGEVALAALKDVVGPGAEDKRHAVSKARMNYRRLEDGRADSFDFINESVAKSVEVEIEEDGAGPTDLSASQGIAKAYDDLHDDISRALQGLG